MHYIKKLTVSNFRSCREISLSLNKFSPLVGYNNAGKSNLMYALYWFVSPSALKENDFFDVDVPVVVTGEINGVNDQVLDNLGNTHRSKIIKFVDDEKIKFRRIQNAPGISTKDIILQVYDPASADDPWINQPTGITNAIKKLFPEPIFIKAMEDAEEDATKYKTGTTLGKLLSEFSKPLDLDYGRDLQKSLNKVSEKLSPDSENRVEELKNFDKGISTVVAGFFPGINLHLDIPVPDVNDLFRQSTLKISEEGKEGAFDFSRLGHGTQRSIQMGLIRYLADIKCGEENESQCRLLLIEEPELFLHPQAIYQIKNALTSLSEKNFQIVFATHSPFMVSRENILDVCIVKKENDSTVVTETVNKLIKNRVDGEGKQLGTVFNVSNSSEWLFCDKVLLVEGDTEKNIIPFLYNIFSKGSRGNILAVVSTNGCESLPECMDVFKELGINCYGLVDLDFAVRTGTSKKRQWVKEDSEHYKKLISQLKEMEENDSRVCLDSNGLPKNKKGGGLSAAEVYSLWAFSYIDTANEIHNELKKSKIWAWPVGDIEEVLDLPKNNKKYSEWSSFQEKVLSDGWESCTKHPDILKGFFDWLS